MRRVLNGIQMQATDRYTIDTMGVPAMVLMEKASEAVVEAILDECDENSRILVACGSGNNGADGMAVARMLYLKRRNVCLFLAGNASHFTNEAAWQWKIAENYGVPVTEHPVFEEYTVIVDALFGTGLSREIKGAYKEIIEKINASGANVYAVDIPSGIHAYTGQVMGAAIRADRTVTFSFYKSGLLLYPGASYAGKLTLHDAGIYEADFAYAPDMYVLEKDDMKLKKPRRPDGNKGTFGKVLVFAGSKHIYGACCMCVKAAFMSGAGMVKVLTSPENAVILKAAMPEAMVEAITAEGWKDQFDQAISWADFAAAGPGIQTTPDAQEMLFYLLDHFEKPMVLDADALNILSAHMEKLKNHSGDLILTPHIGEMCRMSGKKAGELKADAIEEALHFSAEHQVILVMKDARTLIADRGERVYIHTFGNSGMATAGSGDVLTGTIAGLLGSCKHTAQAACLGVLLHGLSGDAAAKDTGEDSLMAMDICGKIPEILKEFH